MKSGARIILDYLEQESVPFVAGMPGGANLPLYDALHSSSIVSILARHEQGAGFIAQGYARATGKVGVCFATSGPGATNLITSLADAKLDSIPIIAITGQVPRDLIGTDAFQEVDTIGIARPGVKEAFFARDAQSLYDILPAAFAVARSGRPGPVLIDVPKDVQREVAAGRYAIMEPSRGTLSSASVEEAARMIQASRRPVLYAGGGIIHSNASEILIQIAERNAIPVVTTLMGIGSIPTSHPRFFGMLGMHGEPYTNLLLEECDLLIAVGSRFDDRATGKLSEFCPDAKVIHVDIDRTELGKLRKPDLAIQADARTFLSALRNILPFHERREWTALCDDLRRDHPSENHDGNSTALSYLREISDSISDHDVITTDVGQHQMWAAQVCRIREPRTFLTSGGLGTMGFGLPAAIGAALGTGKRAVCISGDGSILLNVQELALLADLNLDVKVVVFDNANLGMVRQQQQMFYGQRYSSSRFERAVDFVTLARSFGIPGYSASDRPISSILREPGPALIHLPIDENENVYPMVAPGSANRDMIRRPAGKNS